MTAPPLHMMMRLREQTQGAGLPSENPLACDAGQHPSHLRHSLEHQAVVVVWWDHRVMGDARSALCAACLSTHLAVRAEFFRDWQQPRMYIYDGESIKELPGYDEIDPVEK
jgi:hypothetical protein